MAIEFNWYHNHVIRPASQDPYVRRGRDLIEGESENAAIRMARELEFLHIGVTSGEVLFGTYIGMMQVAAFAVGISVEQQGEMALFPLPEEQVEELSTVYGSFREASSFSPSGDIQQDIRRVQFIIAGQTDGYDTESEGYSHYRDGVELGLARWRTLTS